MGMYDNLQYLGHEYQTKDTPAQRLDLYKIQINQDDGHWYLWHQEYDAEWVDDPMALFGGYLDQKNKRWRACQEFDGLIRFYREDDERGGYKSDAWIEYQALFMNGQMLKLTQTQGEPLTQWLLGGIKQKEKTK